MTRRRWLAGIAAMALLLSACGDDGEDGEEDAATTTVAVAPTTTTTTSTTEVPATADQAAIWPAPEVVFTTPEEAAEDFVASVLGVAPTLGEFRAGDVRSGEIEVIFPGEGPSSTPIPRSTLLLRQLGPDDGWFVIGAVSDNASIDEPEASAEIASGALTVSGRARGFEGTVIVSAIVAGEGTPLDQAIAAGGAFATPEPFTADLDLAAGPGTVVAVIVQGGVGLETDTGDFSAIPVVIAG